MEKITKPQQSWENTGHQITGERALERRERQEGTFGINGRKLRHSSDQTTAFSRPPSATTCTHGVTQGTEQEHRQREAQGDMGGSWYPAPRASQPSLTAKLPLLLFSSILFLWGVNHTPASHPLLLPTMTIPLENHFFWYEIPCACSPFKFSWKVWAKLVQLLSYVRKGGKNPSSFPASSKWNFCQNWLYIKKC